jgi:hypothetical protein
VQSLLTDAVLRRQRRVFAIIYLMLLSAIALSLLISSVPAVLGIAGFMLVLAGLMLAWRNQHGSRSICNLLVDDTAIIAQLSDGRRVPVTLRAGWQGSGAIVIQMTDARARNYWLALLPLPRTVAVRRALRLLSVAVARPERRQHSIRGDS